MQEDEDFNLLHVEEVEHSEEILLTHVGEQVHSKKHSGNNAKIYMMTLDSFYILLMDIPDKH